MGLEVIERVEQVASTALGDGHKLELVKEARQAGAAQVGHTQDAEVAVAVFLGGEQGNDVRVLQLGQRQMLLAGNRG